MVCCLLSSGKRRFVWHLETCCQSLNLNLILETNSCGVLEPATMVCWTTCKVSIDKMVEVNPLNHHIGLTYNAVSNQSMEFVWLMVDIDCIMN